MTLHNLCPQGSPCLHGEKHCDCGPTFPTSEVIQVTPGPEYLFDLLERGLDELWKHKSLTLEECSLPKWIFKAQIIYVLNQKVLGLFSSSDNTWATLEKDQNIYEQDKAGVDIFSTAANWNCGVNRFHETITVVPHVPHLWFHFSVDSLSEKMIMETFRNKKNFKF